MIKDFKEFLYTDVFNQICEILDQMDEEELDDFGYYLFTEFFDDEEEPDLFDVKSMVLELGPDFYDDILDMLEEIDLDEAVSRIMKQKNYNRKKRKYMQTSKSELRRSRQKRKQAARQNKSQRKRYYKLNKKKIADYQKSRREAIKKGKHKVKVRKSS